MGLGKRLGGGDDGLSGRGILAGLAAVILLLGACASGLVAWALSESYHRTVENNRNIDANFKRIGRAMAAFRAQNRRWPESHEMGVALEAGAEKIRYEVNLNSDSECQWALVQRPEPAADDPILSIWRGEWFECYDVATRQTTLSLNTDDLAMSGSVNGDILLFGLLAASCIAAAVWVGRLSFR